MGFLFDFRLAPNLLFSFQRTFLNRVPCPASGKSVPIGVWGPSGANSIAWYNEFLADPSKGAVLKRILDYNEDDYRAMVAVKEYFKQAIV